MLKSSCRFLPPEPTIPCESQASSKPCVARSIRDMSSPSTGHTVASAPFDDIQRIADVIVISSDNVLFHLVKAILIIASPFFSDMFSLVQPPKPDAQSIEKIPISEDSITFDALMRLCYPVDDPKIESLSQLENVLAAAMKYQMKEAIHIMTASLRNSVTGSSLQVYAIASRLRLAEEEKLAATTWRAQSHSFNESGAEFTSTLAGGSYVPEMSTISAGAYYRLLRYMRTGDVAVLSPPSYAGAATDTPSEVTPVSSLYPDTIQADVVLRSTDNILFPVHSVVLHLASASNLLGAKDKKQDDKAEPEEFSVDLNAFTLGATLKLCYNTWSPSANLDLEELKAVIKATQRYELADLVPKVKRQMMSLADADSMSLYFTTSVVKWNDEVLVAARRVVDEGKSNEYSPQMEAVPASLYHRLLEFQHRYLWSLRHVVDNDILTRSASWQSLSAARFKTTPVTVSLPVLEKIFDDIRTLQGVMLAADCPYCAYCGSRRTAASNNNSYYGSYHTIYYNTSSCSCLQKAFYTRNTSLSDLLSMSENLEQALKSKLEAV
jgi:hypothetical protein